MDIMLEGNCSTTSLMNINEKILNEYQQSKFNSPLKGSYIMVKWDFPRDAYSICTCGISHVQISTCDMPH